MSGSTIGLPLPPSALCRGDILWRIVAGERRSFRVHCAAKERPNGFKILVERADTERRSTVYLYFAAGEMAFKAPEGTK
jgi:hypothetical protein